jgi:hypothetical protein
MWTLMIMLGFEMQVNPWQQRLHNGLKLNYGHF